MWSARELFNLSPRCSPSCSSHGSIIGWMSPSSTFKSGLESLWRVTLYLWVVFQCFFFFLFLSMVFLILREYTWSTRPQCFGSHWSFAICCCALLSLLHLSGTGGSVWTSQRAGEAPDALRMTCSFLKWNKECLLPPPSPPPPPPPFLPPLPPMDLKMQLLW